VLVRVCLFPRDRVTRRSEGVRGRFVAKVSIVDPRARHPFKMSNTATRNNPRRLAPLNMRAKSPGHLSATLPVSMGRPQASSAVVAGLEREVADLKAQTALRLSSMIGQSPAANQVVLNTLQSDKERLKRRTEMCARP
jgi:hypothetical protein